MSDRLKGKRAFVTAAAAGIGRACAMAFAREGATVFATDIDETRLAALKSEGIAEVAQARRARQRRRRCDRQTRRQDRHPAQCRRLRASRHRAGMLRRRLGFFLRPQRQVDAPHHPRVPAGHAGKRRRHDRQHLVCRRRVQGRAQPLRLWRDQGRGRGADPRGRRRLHHQGHPLQLHLPRHHRDALDAGSRRGRGPQRPRDVRRRQPMGRLGTAEEIASLAVYLASDESAFTTGVAHVIDGGWTL